MNAFICTITVATDNQKSNAMFLPRHCRGVMVACPALEDAAHTASLEVYTGTAPGFNDFSNAVLAATNDTDWTAVDTVLFTGNAAKVSSVAKDWPLGGQWIRIGVSAAQAANKAFTLFALEGR